MILKLKISADSVAMVVALVAVTLALWEGYESRQHNRKSVIPILNSETNISFNSVEDAGINTDESSIEVKVESVGLGPIKITGFEVFFNKKPEETFEMPGYTTSYPTVIQAVRGIVDGVGSVSIKDDSIDKGNVLSVEDEKVLLAISSDVPRDKFEGVLTLVQDTLDIFICYCSIYDDQCDITHIGKHPELSPKHCPIDE